MEFPQISDFPMKRIENANTLKRKVLANTSWTWRGAKRRSIWQISSSALQEHFQGYGCERSVKIKLKIQKIDFENQINTILKIKDLASTIKSCRKCCILEKKSRKKLVTFGGISAKFGQNSGKIREILEKKQQKNQQF